MTTMRSPIAKLSYRRIGNMTYVVSENGTVLGKVWRTHFGWSAATNDGTVVVEDYPGSRGVAAGNLRSAS